MEDKLNINSILKAENNNPIKIGELNSNVIKALDLDCSPRNIILTADRIYHCEKHKSEYKDESSYNKSIESIPEIISNPDYIGFNESNNSVQYVKKLEDTTLIAVRISYKGALKLRTVFPLTEFDLNKKIALKKLIPYNN